MNFGHFNNEVNIGDRGTVVGDRFIKFSEVDDNPVDKYTVLYMSFDNDYQTIEGDYAGATVTTYGSPSFNKEQGHSKGCLYLNGSSYIDIPSFPVTVFQNDYTVEMWNKCIYDNNKQVLFAMTQDCYIGSLNYGGTYNLWAGSRRSGSSWDIIESDSSMGRGSIQIKTGIWQHVAYTFSKKDYKYQLYVDGKLSKEIIVPDKLIGDSNSSFTGLRIGGWGDHYGSQGYSENGYIDNFRISNVVRYKKEFDVNKLKF